MRYIAFLRAINVGGRVVKMDQLKRLFEELPLSDVETYIASGNVIFTSAARTAAPLEAKIEAHLERRLGYAVPTFLRTPAELAAVGPRAAVSRRGALQQGCRAVRRVRGRRSRRRAFGRRFSA